MTWPGGTSRCVGCLYNWFISDHLARLDVGLLHSYALAFDFVLIHLVSISVSAINNDADLSVNQWKPILYTQESVYYTGLNLPQSTCQFHPQSCIKGRQIPGIDLEGASNIEMCEKCMYSPVMGSIFSLTESNSPNFPKYSWAERHLLHWIDRPDTRIPHQLIRHLKLKWTCKSSWEASWGNPPTKSFLSSSSPILNLISEINRNSVQNWTMCTCSKCIYAADILIIYI